MLHAAPLRAPPGNPPEAMTLTPNQAQTPLRQALIGLAVCACLVLKQLAGVVACVCLATSSPAHAVHQGEHAHLDSGGHAHQVHASGECSEEEDCSDDEDCHSQHSCDQDLPHSLGDHGSSFDKPNTDEQDLSPVLTWNPSDRTQPRAPTVQSWTEDSLWSATPGPPPPGRIRPRAPPLSC